MVVAGSVASGVFAVLGLVLLFVSSKPVTIGSVFLAASVSTAVEHAATGGVAVALGDAAARACRVELGSSTLGNAYLLGACVLGHWK